MTTYRTSQFAADNPSNETFTASCRAGMETWLDDSPLTTTLTVFAVGLALGVAAGAAFADPPNAGRRRTAESIGRRVLGALHDYVPNSIYQRIRS